MSLNRTLLFLACVLGSMALYAQGEVLRAIRGGMAKESEAAKANGLNTHYIYQFLPQTLPIQDDFSVDRTRKRWARPDDPGVTLSETIYRLEALGVSEPGMRYATDTTFLYLTDMQEPPVTVRTALPSISVTVRDLAVYPPTETVEVVWPAYNIFDTIQSPSQDTLFLLPPLLLQDSLLVYSVPADTRTYIRPDNSIVPLILWEDDDVHVNGTYPIDPPTIGVASFDGLSRTGMPYDFVTYTSYGIADRLTSVPIDLQYPASDSVYLSFFYQAQGRSGDTFIQPQDSLVLEFYAPEEDTWYRVWRTPYVAQAPFEQVLIPIKQFRYLKNGFRMRFLNYATLSGAFDHWHIDYVRLATQRSFNDTRLVDVAYVMPESTLLENYTAMPYTTYSISPDAFMLTNANVDLKNLDVDDRFIRFGMQAREENGSGLENFENGLNTSGNASSTFSSLHPINSGANDFEYDPALSTDAAFWRVKYWANTTPDINRYNDTITFIQEISNYYAYDDGSAEQTYGLNSAGGKLAYRFDLAQGDSLRAIRMYFSPSLNPPPSASPVQGSFLITIWKGLSPEVIQHQNFSFSAPQYKEDGLDRFVEYPLDSTIYVEGTIYIGWTQTNDVVMNLGFDRNRNNASRIFYRTTGSFTNTSFSGSLMMRPVFVAAVDPFAGVEEPVQEQEMFLYPNPADEHFMIRTNGDLVTGNVVVLDALGRKVLRTPYRSGAPVPSTGLATGLHIVRVLDASGSVVAQEKLLIQR
ncbi:MAG: T9SS type A sorting domain-containing protein [Flavobacteriales bacterium]|nr:T9SS type A sorting domain-containing protein [Flavobacteriales bacterium]